MSQKNCVTFRLQRFVFMEFSLNQPVVCTRSWGFHTVGGGSVTGGGRWSCRHIQGRISERGMASYSPRMRRNRGVAPRGNVRRAFGAAPLGEGGRRDPLDQWRGVPEQLGPGQTLDWESFAYYLFEYNSTHISGTHKLVGIRLI